MHRVFGKTVSETLHMRSIPARVGSTQYWWELETRKRLAWGLADGAVAGVLCGRGFLHTTTDPDLVTCEKCIRELAEHVGTCLVFE